jgi:hypothetical protein
MTALQMRFVRIENRCTRPQLWSNPMRFVPAAILLAALAVPAVAQDAAPTARQACRTDYQSLCPGIHPGNGRVIACFREHRDQLSGGCVQALKAAHHADNRGG